MPGHTIDGFLRKSAAIANAGIYDLRVHHDDVLTPILRQWRVFDLDSLHADGNKARDEFSQFLQGLDVAADRFLERRAERHARHAIRHR
jgi:acyl-[acyl-carrier-protein] desaturase